MGWPHQISVASLIAALPIFFGSAHGQGQQYCSSQMTGDLNAEIFNPYQSNGACRDSCSSGYAFAIVQYTSCWCSNYIPAAQQSTGDCGQNCPGFPDEKCGNVQEGLYGYIPLGPDPSGTLGAGPSPTQDSSQVAPPSSSPDKEIVTDEQTVTMTLAPSTSVVISYVTSDSSAAQPSATDDGASTTIRVITVSGAPVTEFITTRPTQTSSSGAGDNQSDNDDSSGSSTGVIAGAVVGGVAGVAAVGGFMFWFLMRRRRQNNELLDNDGNDNGAPRRNTSTLSRTGLLRSRMEKENPAIIIPAPTYRRGSSNGRDSQSDHASPTSERRNSRPLFYDQRLNPSALMALENRSHTSVATIEDNRDYTRTLNVRNPDPE